MPLVTMKCPPKPQYTVVTGRSVNQRATFMHLTIDPTSKFDPETDSTSFGWAPMSYQNSVGNVLVARTSKNPLDCETVEAFGDYCRWHVHAYCQWQGESEAGLGVGLTEQKQRVLTEITPKKWQEYFKQWKAAKAGALSGVVDGGASDLKASAGVQRMALNEKDSDRLSSILLGLRSGPF